MTSHRREIMISIAEAAVMSATMVAIQIPRILERDRSLGIVLGACIAWSAIWGGAAWVRLTSKRMGRELVAAGMPERGARARTKSWARRRGIVALLIGAAVAVVSYVVGLFGMPLTLGEVMRGIGMTTPMFLLFTACLACIEAAVGTPTGRGPHCANCEYPAPGGVGSVCTECGRRLAFAVNIQEGVRTRRPWVCIVAASSLVCGVGLIYLAVNRSATALVAWLPTDGLVGLVESGQRAWAGAAATELSKRTLTPEQTEALEQAITRSVLPPGFGPADPAAPR